MTDFETWGPPEPVTPPSCVACRSLLEAPDEDGWMRCPNGHGHFRSSFGPSPCTLSFADEVSPYASQELAEHRAEDEATLRDYLAAEGVGRDRADGG